MFINVVIFCFHILSYFMCIFFHILFYNHHHLGNKLAKLRRFSDCGAKIVAMYACFSGKFLYDGKYDLTKSYMVGRGGYCFMNLIHRVLLLFSRITSLISDNYNEILSSFETISVKIPATNKI